MANPIPLFNKKGWIYTRDILEQVGLLGQRPRSGWRTRHQGGALPFERVFTDDDLATGLPGYDNLPEDIIKIDGRDTDSSHEDGVFPIVLQGADGYYPGSLTRCCRIWYDQAAGHNAYMGIDFGVEVGDTDINFELIYNISTTPSSALYHIRAADDSDFTNGTEAYYFLDQYNRYLVSGQRVNGSATSTSPSSTITGSIAAGRWWQIRARLDATNQRLWTSYSYRGNYMWDGVYSGWKYWSYTRGDWPASPGLHWLIAGFAPATASVGSLYIARMYVGAPEDGWPTSEDSVSINFDEETSGQTPSNITIPAGSGSWTVVSIPSDQNSYTPPGYTYAIRSPTTSGTRFFFPLNRAADGCLRFEALVYCSYSGLAVAYLRMGLASDSAWYPDARIGLKFGNNTPASYEWISRVAGIYDVEGGSETEFGAQGWTSTSPYRPDWNRWMLFTFEFDQLYSNATWGEYGRITVGVRRMEDGNKYPTVMYALYPPSGWSKQGVGMPYAFFDFESADAESAYVYVAQYSAQGDGYDYPLGAKL